MRVAAELLKAEFRREQPLQVESKQSYSWSKVEVEVISTPLIFDLELYQLQAASLGSKTSFELFG